MIKGILRAATLTVAALLLVPANSVKAAWPEKPIKIVLPFGAGGVADVTARIMADKLSQKLGQRVVIENMPGPGGINAARAVITAPPNGYTLRFEGQGGAAGFANGEAKVTLAPADADQTTLAYAVKAQVGGKLAQIGSRLIDAATAKLAEDFFTRFVERVAPPVAEVATPVPAATSKIEGGANRWVRVLAIGIMVAILIYLYTKGVR